MQTHYDITQPRVAIISQDVDRPPAQSSRELGQCATFNEAMFWLACGYRVEVSRWNGKFFETYENYYPEDL